MSDKAPEESLPTDLHHERSKFDSKSMSASYILPLQKVVRFLCHEDVGCRPPNNKKQYRNTAERTQTNNTYLTTTTHLLPPQPLALFCFRFSPPLFFFFSPLYASEARLKPREMRQMLEPRLTYKLSSFLFLSCLTTANQRAPLLREN